LAFAACIVKTLTVTGAADADTVELGMPGSVGNLGALLWSGYVSAPSTVTFHICNLGGSVTLPATATIRADVWHH
jgi:hypothetical protein